jgi:uncharacterized protein (DUF1778 family)
MNAPRKNLGKRKQKSGYAKLKASGKRAILLGVSQEEYRQLKAAAECERRSVAGFVTYYAVQTALEVLELANLGKG